MISFPERLPAPGRPAPRAVGLTCNGHRIEPAVAPNDRASSLTGRDYLSFSQVNQFRACPRKWAFSYVEDASKAFIPQALLFGSAFHAGVQAYYEGLMIGQRLPLDDMLSLYRAEFARRRAGDEGLPVLYGKSDDEASLFAQAQRMFQSFLASPLARPDGDVVAVEEELRASIDPELPDVLAKVDLVLMQGDKLVVVDLKTSRSRWTPETAGSKAEQLLLYHRLLAHLQPDGGGVSLRFHVVTKGKEPAVQDLEVPYDPKDAAGVVESMKPVWRAMQAKAYFASPSPMNCATCPYQRACSAYRGGGDGE